jgi:chromosomal replication initiation ATPase DnaA
MERIIRKVSECTGVGADDIKSRKRTHDVCEARRIFIYLSHELYGNPLSSIALFLSKRTHQDISSQLMDFKQHLRIYKGLNRRVKEIRDAFV